jgi:hypothetical protein
VWRSGNAEARRMNGVADQAQVLSPNVAGD